MRILAVHNYYGDYALGGEGSVFETEADLLQSHGHVVSKYVRTNSEFLNARVVEKIRAFWGAPWSPKGYQAIRAEIDRFQPDIMHVHNFFLVLSPSVFRAAKDAGVPTVATLHNYRLISPCSQLLRNGRVCEMCLNRNPWRIMLYRCYRKSFLANLLRYRIYYSGKKKYGWLDDIDAFIALTEFGKRKYIEGGLPQGRMYVKPNCTADAIEDGKLPGTGHGAVFVGRISREKGIRTLIEAWRGVDYPLTIVGDGPELSEIRAVAAGRARMVGMKSHDGAMQAIHDAAFMVFPSEWYEGFPLTILEAMASGRAVLASDLGPRGEMVQDGRTGLLFRSGDPGDLREKAKWLIANPAPCAEMGRAGREEYLKKYTEEANYKALLDIYVKTIERNSHKR